MPGKEIKHGNWNENQTQDMVFLHSVADIDTFGRSLSKFYL
jgi:hypothetical protein